MGRRIIQCFNYRRLSCWFDSVLGSVMTKQGSKTPNHQRWSGVSQNWGQIYQTTNVVGVFWRFRVFDASWDKPDSNVQCTVQESWKHPFLLRVALTLDRAFSKAKFLWFLCIALTVMKQIVCPFHGVVLVISQGFLVVQLIQHLLELFLEAGMRYKEVNKLIR